MSRAEWRVGDEAERGSWSQLGAQQPGVTAVIALPGREQAWWECGAVVPVVG